MVNRAQEALSTATVVVRGEAFNATRKGEARPTQYDVSTAPIIVPNGHHCLIRTISFLCASVISAITILLESEFICSSSVQFPFSSTKRLSVRSSTGRNNLNHNVQRERKPFKKNVRTYSNFFHITTK